MDLDKELDDIFQDPLLGDISAREKDIFNMPDDMKKVIERKQAEYIAQRVRCEDFYKYESGFRNVHNELKAGKRNLVKISKTINLMEGHYYVVGGQLVLLEKILENYESSNRAIDGRTRCIYEDGTESDILLQTLRKNVLGDGYGVTETEKEINDYCFSNHHINNTDIVTGYVYVLSSLSDNPEISGIEDLYKIGFSTNPVEERIANAANEPTYLMAPVKIEASYMVANLNSQKFEDLVNQVLKSVQLSVKVVDGNGIEHEPREWFVVPLGVVDAIIRKIIDGSIVNFVYNPKMKCLEKRPVKNVLSVDTRGLKVLTLRIKQFYFNEILSGDKTIEYRKVKQTNLNKYTYVDPSDGKRYLRRFDALRLTVGNYGEGSCMLVSVVDTVFADGIIEYHLGEIIESAT